MVGMCRLPLAWLSVFIGSYYQNVGWMRALICGRTSHKAVVWMLGAVCGYAFLPLLLWAGVQELSPWVFVSMWYIAYGLLHATLRQITASVDDRDERHLVLWGDLRAIKPMLLALLAVCQVSWVLFAVAVTLADPSIVTVIFESWPMLFGFITVTSMWQKWMLDGHPQQVNGRRDWLFMLVMMALGAVGVGLVIVSDTVSLAWSKDAPFGMMLAGVAALAGTLGAATQQATGEKQQVDKKRDSAAVSVTGNITAQLLLVPLLLFIAMIVSNEDAPFSIRGVLLAAAAGGAGVVGNWCLHKANYLAREIHGQTAASINSLYYFVPVLAVILLTTLADTNIEHPKLFAAGVAIVVIVNIVLHFLLTTNKTARRSSKYFT